MYNVKIRPLCPTRIWLVGGWFFFALAFVGTLRAEWGSVYFEEMTEEIGACHLVAVVVGHEYARNLYNLSVPTFSTGDGKPKATWFESIAPTNFAAIRFSVHDCTPFTDHRTMFPTNRLFMFPVFRPGDYGLLINDNMLHAITPTNRVQEFCQMYLNEKRFFVSRQDIDEELRRLEAATELSRKEIRDAQLELADTEDPPSSNRVRRLNALIRERTRWMEQEPADRATILKQAEYLESRVKWLRSQGVEVPE